MYNIEYARDEELHTCRKFVNGYRQQGESLQIRIWMKALQVTWSLGCSWIL